jgi:hypothetical protein
LVVQNAILLSYLGLVSVLVQGIAIRLLTGRLPDRWLIVTGLTEANNEALVTQAAPPI